MDHSSGGSEQYVSEEDIINEIDEEDEGIEVDEDEEEEKEQCAGNAKEEADADDEEEHEEDEQAWRWAFLPDVCLQHVFWWLGDRSRAHASLVCRHWRLVMRSPALWRSRSFLFTGRLTKTRLSEQEAAIGYARHLGGYLEELEVRLCPPHCSLVSRRLQQSLRALLAELCRAGARLCSLTLDHLELDHGAWTRSVRGGLVRSLALFLRHDGARLGRLSLRAARLSLPQGLELLEAVSATQQHLHLGGHSPGLLSLDLEEFFSASVAIHGHPAFPRAMRRFRGLQSLALSYSCISDELLEVLGSMCGAMGRGSGATTLRSLSLRCHVREPHAQVVCGAAWARLASTCPGLAVQLHVERVVNTNRLGRVLLPEVPVRDFSMTSCYFSEQDWSAKPVLADFLPHYQGQLQRLTLDLNNCNESLDEEMVALVIMCGQLLYLRVWAFLEISFVDQLLLSCMEKKCSLKTIKVRLYTCDEETQEEEELLEEVLSCYQHLIDSELTYCSAIIYPII